MLESALTKTMLCSHLPSTINLHHRRPALSRAPVLQLQLKLDLALKHLHVAAISMDPRHLLKGRHLRALMNLALGQWRVSTMPLWRTGSAIGES